MNSRDLRISISELAELLTLAVSTSRIAGEILGGTLTHNGHTILNASSQISHSLRNLIGELQTDLDNVLRQEASDQDDSCIR